MGALVAVHATELLDVSTDQAAAAVRKTTGPLKLRQMTAVGSNTAAGTEVVTGGGYTSGAGAPTVAFAAASGTAPPQTTNSGAITITSWPRVETITAIEVWDSIPARKWWGALTASKTMAIGDTLSYAIGSVALQMP